MSTIDTIRQNIEQRFRDNWTGTNLNTNVRYSNVEFDLKAVSGDWVSLDIRFANNNNAEIGGNLSPVSVRRNGIIYIEIYSPVDSGTGNATTLVDEAISIYENQQFNSIQCLSANVRHDGVPNIQGTDPQWYRYSVRVEFYKYDIT